jgi:hypothetical protein
MMSDCLVSGCLVKGVFLTWGVNYFLTNFSKFYIIIDVFLLSIRNSIIYKFKAMATTTKSKVQSAKVKNPETISTQKKDNKSTQTNKPTEEQIRRKAQELYDVRLKRGEYGNELADWQNAEKILGEE